MTGLHFDALEPQEYDPRLYEPDAQVDPIADLRTFGDAQLDQYRTLGFVSIGTAFAPDRVRATLDAFAEIVSLPEAPPRVELQFEAAGKGVVEHLSGEDRLDYVRKLMWFTHVDPRFESMAYDPDLLDVVGRILGSEPELFQEMALFKPPGIGREKPWHQDHAYFNIPEGTPVVGVWIALDAATLENGCMVFLPGGHREGPLPHFQRRDWQLCDSEILARGRGVAAPLPSGGCLIFDGLTPHGTPTNRSQARRRALQFHYVPKGTPRTTIEDRMAIFGEGAHGASC